MDKVDNNVEGLIEQLIYCRKEKKFTQRALAYACNIPQSTLARIETGKTIPQIDTLMKIADVLEMELKFVQKENMIPEVRRWDGLEFSSYWKDELMAKVSVHGNSVDVTRFVLHPVKQIFFSDKMNIFQLSQIFEDRCWERDRADINNILKALGLKYFDPLEIIKKTHGVSYNDFLWFQFSGENFRYKDMKTRRCC